MTTVYCDCDDCYNNDNGECTLDRITMSGSRSTFDVINKESFDRVEVLIRQYALDNHDEQLGLLQAKVYAYEQIIANSNFAPMIKQVYIKKRQKWKLTSK